MKKIPAFRGLRRIPRRAWAAGGLFALLAPLLAVALVPLDLARLEPTGGTVFADRHGQALRCLPNAEGARCRPVPLDHVPLLLQQAFLAAEDERFQRHPGVDPLAVARALRDNVRRGRVVSGASTLTAQLIRLAYPRPRTYRAKLVEALRALKADALLSKEEILERYLNRVPLGNNLVGVAMAAEVYFDKPLRRLSPAECALLAALPKAPGRLNPYGPAPDALRARRDWVLARMETLDFLVGDAAAAARTEPVCVRPKRFPFEAPHLVDRLLVRGAGRGVPVVATTLDLAVQQRVEAVLRAHLPRLHDRGARQAAAMVVDNRTRGVLALAGSVDYATTDAGFNDGTAAPRSAGSTLKPFLYGLALDCGLSAATLLEDVERGYPSVGGEYVPSNYDRRQYGPVLLRTALGNSLNLSAVHLINRIGHARCYALLDGLGLIGDPAKGPDHYGLGLAIGNVEVTLERLVTAYAALADGGVLRPLRYQTDDPYGPPVAAMSPQAAFIISDVLADPAARSLTFASIKALDFPYRVAWKSGTSTRYRDGWIAGFTPAYTVGVWVGNFDGSPTERLSGAEGAGPIFADILRGLHPDGAPGWFAPPRGVEQAAVCARSGMAPTSQCPHRKSEWFLAGTEPRTPCTFHREDAPGHALPAAFAGWAHDRAAHGFAGYRTPPVAKSASGAGLRIVSPRDGDRFVLSPMQGEASLALEVRAPQALPAVTWLIDGVEWDRTQPPYRARWPLARGAHRIAAVGPDSVGDEVRIYVE